METRLLNMARIITVTAMLFFGLTACKEDGYSVKYIYITRPFDKKEILSDVKKLLLKDKND